MRALLVSVLITLSFILSACGGGGGGSDSASDVKVSLGMNFDKSRASANGFYVGNTKIDSVTISYTNNAGSSGSENVTAQASDGMVELNGLVLNSTYTFTVLAMTEGNVQACTGSTSVLIAKGQENTATIECVFPDNLAVGNAVFNFVETLMSETPTAENIDQYVANDFGVYDGYNRAEFIADLIDDPSFAFTDPTVRLERVEILTGVERAVGTDSLIKFHFSDGSVAQEYVGLVKEDGKWKLAGNGKRYEADVSTQAYYIIPHSSNPPANIYSGVSTEFYDPANVVSSINVSAAPMSETYSFMRETCAGCDGFSIDHPHIYDIPHFFSNHYINLFESGTNPSVAAGQKYTLRTYYSDTTEDEFTLTAYGKPIQTSTLNTGYFAMVPVTTSQNIAEYIANTHYTFTIIKPTAYDAQLIEINLEYTDYNNTHGQIEGMIPLTANTFTVDFSKLAGQYITDASVFINAYDSEGRVFTTVIELYYDAENVTLSASGYTALANAISKMTTSQMTEFVDLMSFSNDTNVRSLFSKISDASASGLTPGNVSNAYSVSLTRADPIGNPYSSGTPEYVAFENLVDSFYNLLSSNSEAAFSIATFIVDLSSDGFQAVGTLLGIADDEGFDTYAQVLSGSLEEIIAEVEAHTGNDVEPNDGYTVEEGLSYVQATDGSSYYDFYGVSGFLTSDGVVTCNSSATGNASIYIENDDDGELYTINSAGDRIAECYSMRQIEDTSSSYYGYSYAVLGSVDAGGYTKNTIVMFLNDEGNIQWVKEYAGLSSVYFNDAEISADNLLMLFTDTNDREHGYVYEVLPDGTTGISSKVSSLDAQSSSPVGNIWMNDLMLKDGKFAILGTGHVSGSDFIEGLAYYGTYITSGTTTMTASGGLLDHFQSSEFGDFTCSFISGSYNGTDLLLTGIGTNQEDALLISKLDTLTGKFYNAISNSESIPEQVLMFSAPDSEGTESHFAIVKYSDGKTEVLKFSFDSNGDFIPGDNVKFDMSTEYGAVSEIYAITSDGEGSLLFTGNLRNTNGNNLLLGAMSADNLTINNDYDPGTIANSGFEKMKDVVPANLLTVTISPQVFLTDTDITSAVSLTNYVEANPAMSIVVNMLM